MPPQVTTSSGIAGYVPGNQTNYGAEFGAQMQDFATKMVELKRQKELDERTKAAQTLDAAYKMQQQGMPVDFPSVQKAAKILGIDFNQAAQGPIQVNPQEVAKIGNATQGNKAGVQAANPPSESAANKAPGGGVIKTSTSSGVLEKTVAGDTVQPQSATPDQSVANPALMQQAHMNAEERWGQIANDAQAHAAGARQIEQVKNRAAAGDMKALGQLYMLGEIPWQTDAFKWTQMNDKQKQDVLDISAGHESQSDRAKREYSTFNSILSNYKDMITPGDAQRTATAITNGDRIPADVEAKTTNLETLGREADAFYKFAQVFPANVAANMASAVARGVPITEVLPASMQNVLSLPERQTRAQEVTAGAHKEAADAAMISALKDKQTDWLKMQLAIREKGTEDLQKRVEMYATMKKQKAAIPPEMEQQLLSELGTISGLTPERVKSTWEWLTMQSGSQVGFGNKLSPSTEEKIKQQSGAGQTSTPNPGASLTSPEVLGRTVSGMGDTLSALPDEISKGIGQAPGALQQYLKDFEKGRKKGNK